MKKIIGLALTALLSFTGTMAYAGDSYSCSNTEHLAKDMCLKIYGPISGPFICKEGVIKGGLKNPLIVSAFFSCDRQSPSGMSTQQCNEMLNNYKSSCP